MASEWEGAGTSAADAVLVRWTFAPNADAPGTARSIVHDALDGTDADLDEILLMVSELVTNAVLHTRRNAQLRLMDLGERGFRIEVEDHDAHVPAPKEHAGSDGGFGLRIIDTFARSWGTALFGGQRPNGGGPGKVVWFEVDRR